MAKEKVKKDVTPVTQKNQVTTFDKNVFKENLKKHDAQINHLKKELADNLDEIYKELHKIRDRVNRAMKRLGLEGF